LLAACGGGESDTTGEATGEATDETSASAKSPSSSPNGALTTKEDIDVGGGTVFAAQQVVVTQPTEGEFKGFTAICTHQSCTVSEVSDGTINCLCHGSQFSIEDGSVQAGPATAPLGEVELEIRRDNISLA
jgi:Rieske Fe-S protein